MAMDSTKSQTEGKTENASSMGAKLTEQDDQVGSTSVAEKRNADTSSDLETHRKKRNLGLVVQASVKTSTESEVLGEQIINKTNSRFELYENIRKQIKDHELILHEVNALDYSKTISYLNKLFDVYVTFENTANQSGETICKLFRPSNLKMCGIKEGNIVVSPCKEKITTSDSICNSKMQLQSPSLSVEGVPTPSGSTDMNIINEEYMQECVEKIKIRAEYRLVTLYVNKQHEDFFRESYCFKDPNSASYKDTTLRILEEPLDKKNFNRYKRKGKGTVVLVGAPNSNHVIPTRLLDIVPVTSEKNYECLIPVIPDGECLDILKELLQNNKKVMNLSMKAAAEQKQLSTSNRFCLELYFNGIIDWDLNSIKFSGEKAKLLTQKYLPEMEDSVYTNHDETEVRRQLIDSIIKVLGAAEQPLDAALRDIDFKPVVMKMKKYLTLYIQSKLDRWKTLDSNEMREGKQKLLINEATIKSHLFGIFESIKNGAGTEVYLPPDSDDVRRYIDILFWNKYLSLAIEIKSLSDKQALTRVMDQGIVYFQKMIDRRFKCLIALNTKNIVIKENEDIDIQIAYQVAYHTKGKTIILFSHFVDYENIGAELSFRRNDVYAKIASGLGE